MSTEKKINDDNKSWHQEHSVWMDEVKLWQIEMERLVAHLYLLERALPDHSRALNEHAKVIDKHEKLMSDYECGKAPHCMPSSPPYNSSAEHEEFHSSLSILHEQVRDKHLQLKQTYGEEMKRFRTLAKKMLDEC
jgi:hypothetical protein